VVLLQMCPMHADRCAVCRVTEGKNTGYLVYQHTKQAKGYFVCASVITTVVLNSHFQDPVKKIAPPVYIPL
jgi:hypothetical protein